MNTFRLCFAGWIVVTSQLIVQASSPEVEAAKQAGAKGQITLWVVDSSNVPVRNARVSAGFYNPQNRDSLAEGQTDTNGAFVASGTSVSDMRYTITKDGYYKTSATYDFCKRIDRPVIDGRWQPWNPTNTVVLKEVRTPVAMYAKRVDTPVPQRDSAMGFDLEAGDWVAPCGKGKVSDLLVTYRSSVQDKWTFSRELSITCSNNMDGLCRLQKDMWSVFRSAYEAPTAGYQQVVSLVYDATKYKVLKSECLGDSEYLAFRVRTILDAKGNIVSARYGKVYGPIEYGAGKDNRLRFTYYLNPDGGRNLEFDPGRNLFQWSYTDRRRVAAP